MSIGVGGAGSKLASLLDQGDGTVIDVSGVELEKVDAKSKVRAIVHSAKAQLQGSRKDPAIGRQAFQSIKYKVLELIQGQHVFCSTGGGTGNGVCSEMLEHLSDLELVPLVDKTIFTFVVPYPERESSEFVDNTIAFLEGPVSTAIDAGNTGNLILFSNKEKFKKKLSESKYNQKLIQSLNEFLVIPEKGEELHQLDGTIDYEDFSMYKGKPYFNHFTKFEYDPESPFKKQLQANLNPLLLPPDTPIEALFMLELPDSDLTESFYGILDYFAEDDVAPMYTVLENPNIKKPQITVSLLYSRKPLELVDDFNDISGNYKRSRIKKSVDQHVMLTKLEVDLRSETEKAAKQAGAANDEVLGVLKRIGKI